jgi:hypothetical protein
LLNILLPDEMTLMAQGADEVNVVVQELKGGQAAASSQPSASSQSGTSTPTIGDLRQ